jgi:excisionase family DNA binding protein
MSLCVSEVAERLEVSPRRVLQLIKAGSISARKIAGAYLVEESELLRRQLRGRPLSDRMAWGLLHLLSGGVGAEEFSATEGMRLRQYRQRLGADRDPAGQLMTWVRNRAVRVTMKAQEPVIASLHHDPRLVLSGVSDYRSGISASGQVEGYVNQRDVDGLVKDFLLIPFTPANVVLHVTDRLVTPPVPVALVIADLADYCMPREDSRVEAMLREVLA